MIHLVGIRYQTRFASNQKLESSIGDFHTGGGGVESLIEDFHIRKVESSIEDFHTIKIEFLMNTFTEKV